MQRTDQIPENPFSRPRDPEPEVPQPTDSAATDSEIRDDEVTDGQIRDSEITGTDDPTAVPAQRADAGHTGARESFDLGTGYDSEAPDEDSPLTRDRTDTTYASSTPAAEPSPAASDAAGSGAPAGSGTTAETETTSEPEAPTATASAPVTASPDRPAAHRAPGTAEALITAEQNAEFHTRWREVQATFVDDPAESVRSAEALLTEVMTAVTSAVDSRRAPGAGSAGTEELRTRLRAYRGVVDRLLEV